MSESWFATGFEGTHHEEAKKKSERERVPTRFFLKHGEKKEFIFLDEEPFCIWEHMVKIGDRYLNITCKKGVDKKDPGCPLCAANNKPSYMAFLTVLDITGWQDKKGVWHRNVRKLFPMRSSQLEIFKRYKKSKVGLVGWKVAAERFDEKASKSNLGDYFDLVEKIKVFDEEKYWFESKLEGKKKPPEPFDYMNALAPMSSDEIRAAISDYSTPSKHTDDSESYTDGGDSDAIY